MVSKTLDGKVCGHPNTRTCWIRISKTWVLKFSLLATASIFLRWILSFEEHQCGQALASTWRFKSPEPYKFSVAQAWKICISCIRNVLYKKNSDSDKSSSSTTDSKNFFYFRSIYVEFYIVMGIPIIFCELQWTGSNKWFTSLFT